MGGGGSKPSSDKNVYLGFTSMPVNDKSSEILIALGGVFNSLQEGVCNNHYGDIYSAIQSMKYEEGSDGADPKTVVLALADALSESLAPKEGDTEWMIKDKKLLLNSLTNLITILVNSSAVNGVISQKQAKQNMLDLIASICPNGNPNYTTGAMGVDSKSNFGSSGGNSMYLILIIIVLALLTVCFVYKHKNAPKISLPQQIANFGRSIRSIRRF